MKLFVSRPDHALEWAREGDGTPTAPRRAVGGRPGRPADLYEWMLPLAGLVYLADFLSLIHLWPPLQYLLAGIVLGGTIGKSVVVWRERGGRELPPHQVRHLELVWVAVGSSVMGFAVLVQLAIS